jgi:hypothetical protein
MKKICNHLYSSIQSGIEGGDEILSFKGASYLLAAVLGALGAPSAAYAQATPTTQTEQSKLIRAPDALGVLGNDLFGDRLNFYDGSLEFSQEDVSIPGNNKLPVRVGRRLQTGSRNEANHMFREWELDIPHIRGNFSQVYGWQRLVGGAPSTQRCSNFGAPPDVLLNIYDTYRSFEYWNGSFLYVPGVGGQEILRRNPNNTFIPADGQATPLVTKNDWAIRCLPSLASANGAPAKEGGEGFLAISPDGTQYRFDWLITRPMITLSKPSEAQPSGIYDPLSIVAVTKKQHPVHPLPKGVKRATKVEQVGVVSANGTGGVIHTSMPREEVWILPTVITDRFGNTVRYNYDPSMKNRLLSIVASDGRTLTFGHESGTNFITSVSDGTRTWNYTYGTVESGRTMLTEVTLPDSSKWQLGGMDGGRDIYNQAGLEGLVQMSIEYKPDESIAPYCDQPGVQLDGRTAVGTMVHPSGAVGKFTMRPTSHGRNGVPFGCYSNGTAYGAPYYPAFIDNYSMTEKNISGPGLPNLTWTNDYSGTDVGGWNTCGAACIQPAVVLATDPAGHQTRYVFGATYAVDEGMLKQVDIGWNGSSALRTTATRYNRSSTEPIGFSDQDRGDNWISSHRLPQDQRVITQQDVAFTWQVEQFDSVARPTKIMRSSSLGTRTETIEYADNPAKWVMGQVRRVTGGLTSATEREMVKNTYNATTSNVEEVSNFEHVDIKMAYNADGTLLSKTDGNNYKTTYSNYKRGIPQTISYPDATSETGVVNGYGAVTSHTDQNGFTTLFDPDAMGRLQRIRYPLQDSVVWNNTAVSYQQVMAWEHDLAPGHWRQDVTTGNSITRTYYDALWRPAYFEKLDSSDPAATSRITKRSHDFAGRILFESYPKRNATEIGDGVSHEYDALGRHVGSITASELGGIAASTSYNSGFLKVSTDGRGVNTTYAFQAFDEPTEGASTSIETPDVGYTVKVDIGRDAFGKPTAITRSGGGVSVTRSYVYDTNQRLCKTIEPETAATFQKYDGANNVAWRASGVQLLSPNCDPDSVPTNKRISFGYDALNRLKTTTYSDGSPSIARTYTPDGLLNSITSNGAVWTYGYNKRRLNETEVLAYGGVNYNLVRAYDPNASLSSLKYPIDNLTVTYNPNALGEPRQVGTYASNITYYPNGAIAGFKYGNNVVHSLSQNMRGLPLQSADSGVLSDVYTYDQNANVATITDQQQGVMSRTMGYDNLNRLKSVSNPGLWGNATYTYDAIDNLRTSTITGGGTARTLTMNFPDPATNRLMSTSGGPAAYNFTYNYDAQGNIIQRGSQTYTFDQGNRMTSAAGRATYAYDGSGRRVSVVGTDGVNRIQVYSLAGQILYTAPTGSAGGTKYIYLGRHQVAEVKAAGAN